MDGNDFYDAHNEDLSREALVPCNTCATHDSVREKVTCEVYCAHSTSVTGNRYFLEAKSCNLFLINQAIRPSWTVPSKIQKSSMVKDSNTTPIPSCDQDVHFLDMSPKMGCDFVVVFADWDEFSHSLHLTFCTNDF